MQKMEIRSVWRSPVALAIVVAAVYALANISAQSPTYPINSTGYLVNGVKGIGARAHANPADQTGNSTVTLKMNGLGAAAAPCTITPTSSGNVTFTISGLLNQTTTADGVTYALTVGTGTAPANAAAATGTIISSTPVWLGLTGMLTVPFSVTSNSTNLSVGVPVWYDLQVAETVGGTAAIKNVDCTANES